MKNLEQINALGNRTSILLINAKHAANVYTGDLIKLLREEVSLKALETVEAPKELAKRLGEELAYQRKWLAESQESFARAKAEYDGLVAEIKTLRAELLKLTADEDWGAKSGEQLERVLTAPITPIPVVRA